jgi:hypothetical protein
MRNISRLIIGLLAAALAVLPLAAPAQQPGQPSQPVVVSTSGTITTGGGGPTIFGLTGQSVCTIDIPASSSFTGSLTVQGSTGWETLPVVPFGSTTTQTSIAAAGLYNVVTPALSQIRVIGPTSSGSAAVYVQCTYLPGVVSVVPAPVVIASPLPLPVSISSPLPLPIAPPLTGVSGTGTAAAANQAIVSSCNFTTALPTITTGNVGPNQCDTNGRQIVVGAGTAGTATGGVVTVQGVASGTTVPVLCTAANCPVNVANVGGSAVSLTSGFSAQPFYPANASGGGCMGVTGTNIVTGTQIVKQTNTFTPTASLTQIVAAVASKTIHVCALSYTSQTTGAGSLQIEFGTGTNCGTGTSVLYAISEPGAAPQSTITFGNGQDGLMDALSANALCLVDNATITRASLFITYAIY